MGRERELERLAQALADERCRCCVLRGPAGTGKTRLAQECLARAEARGFTGRRVLATASARSVPLMILYFVAQRFMVAGMTEGSVKG